MISIKLDLEYKKLNKAQKEAVDTIEGAVMVVAGPGTGKTQVLTLRIANILLKTDVNPENILALTFTESGVLSMRKRLVSLIGTPGYKVEITTFHSFCNDVIFKNPEDFSEIGLSRPIDEAEQIGILEDILKNTPLILLKPFGDPLYHLRNCLSAINDLKKEGVSVVAFEKSLQDQESYYAKIDDLYYDKGAYKGQMKGKYQDLQKDISKNKELLKVFRKYQEKLKEEKLFDFNDMLLQVIQALETDKNLLLRLQEKYQYILVDEHQDTNTAQNKLIELLCNFHSNPNLFVVGDANQAIYRFQGASLENFLFFKRLYPDAKIINLVENYRSTQNILDGANSLVSRNLTNEILDETKLRSNVSYKNEVIKVIPFSDYHTEYYYLADDIKRKKAEGVFLKEIAVLVRNNRDLLPVVEVLEQMGVPFSMEADQNVLAEKQICKLVYLFQAVVYFDNDADLIKLMHLDFMDLPTLDLYRLIKTAKVYRSSIYEVLSDKKKLRAANLEEPKKFVAFWENIEKWKKISVNEDLQTTFVRLLEESGLLKHILMLPNSIEVVDKVTVLYENIKLQLQRDPNLKLADYLNYLDLLKSHDILIKRIPKTTLNEAVRLMTVHRSKGQEFDFVYILNAYDGHWGNPRKRSGGINLPWEYLGVKINLNLEIEANEDERRLFYVALTRARQGVSILYSEKALEGKEQAGSQFIEEIDFSQKQIINVDDFENDFLQHKEKLFAPKLLKAPVKKDIDFFKQLFLDRGISATALANYLECPWRFFYRNLLQLPDVKNKSMVFGTAVHKAINFYLRALKIDQASTDDAVNIFKQTLLKEQAEGVDLQELLKKGEDVLPGFFKDKGGSWSKLSQTELFINGVSLTDEIKLTGMIDMIEPTGKGNEVTVYDFKTGRVKSQRETEELYKSQLLFYKILLDRYMQGRMMMTRGVIDFVEPDSKGRYKREIFEMDKESIESLEKQIKFVSSEIMTLAYWDRRCDDKKCEYCKLRDLMAA